MLTLICKEFFVLTKHGELRILGLRVEKGAWHWHKYGLRYGMGIKFRIGQSLDPSLSMK